MKSPFFDATLYTNARMVGVTFEPTPVLTKLELDALIADLIVLRGKMR